jgi:hypothetical protein
LGGIRLDFALSAQKCFILGVAFVRIERLPSQDRYKVFVRPRTVTVSRRGEVASSYAVKPGHSFSKAAYDDLVDSLTARLRKFSASPLVGKQTWIKWCANEFDRDSSKAWVADGSHLQ